jgi:hypothetical protein
LFFFVAAGNFRVLLDDPLENISLVKYFAEFLLRFNSLFWARELTEGDGGEALPALLMGIEGVALAIAVAVVAIFSRNRGTAILLLSFPAIIMTVLFVNSYKVYETFGIAQRGVQGRYVYGGILGRNLSSRLRTQRSTIRAND